MWADGRLYLGGCWASALKSAALFGGQQDAATYHLQEPKLPMAPLWLYRVKLLYGTRVPRRSLTGAGSEPFKTTWLSL